jgi:Receptor L domain
VSRSSVVALLAALLVNPGCASSADGASAPKPERRCGTSAATYVTLATPEDVRAFTGCTVLVGHVQEDSIDHLADFAGLEDVTRIEGTLNVFRSPGFTSLRGLENLEVVDGDLFIHLNPNLASLAALAKLRTVTGRLVVDGNDKIPAAEIDALRTRIGTIRE